MTEQKTVVIDNGMTAKEKLAVCKSCDKFDNKLKICGVCKCFMPVKTRIPGLHCPIEKW